MKAFKYAALTIVLPLTLASCASHTEKKASVEKPNNLSINPSVIRSKSTEYIDSKVERVSEEEKNLSLNVSDVPDLGGIEKLSEQAYIAPDFEGDPVKFVADSLPIKEFTHKVFNEILGVNYVLDATLAAKSPNVTLNISQPLERKEFYETVIQALEQLEVVAYRKNDILYFEQSQGADKKNNIAIGIGNDENDVPKVAGEITQIVPYLYSESRNITSVMKKLSSTQVTVNAKQKLITLEGEYNEIIRAMKIIAMLDVPRAYGRQIRIFEFAYVTPQEAIEQFEALLREDGLSVVSGGDVSFVAMGRINSVVAYASSEDVINRLVYWAQKIDIPIAGDEKQYYVYRPQFAKAEDMATSLQSLLTGATNSSKSNASEGKERTAASSSVSGASTGGTSFSLDKQQNALIFYTTPKEYNRVLNLLEKVDVLPGQVILDVAIMEVTLKDDQSSGIDWQYNNQGFASANLGNVLTGSLSSAGSIAAQGVSGNWQMDLSLNKTFEDGRVLSRPYLIVKDGQSATISSGDQIPIITQVVEGVGDNNNTVSNQVQYRSTGVNVSITPTINSQGIVSLTVDMSVSNQGASNNIQVQTPTITNRSITTEVLSKDGQTIALGGLIQERKSDYENGVPGFSSIPILGNLFKSNTDSYDKTELIMLITTRIVKDSKQIDEFGEAISELYSTPITIK
ncbi:hypothetical protein GBO14_18290 [Pseudoalteromonas shioyasakiensis]|uniref:secretin N-terminal domain-containing protein n=1 Tax=Pseudoalteromonas shioyasakiensis TaxID=1190813 RepID=UPI0020965474|nr:secretin N-terminal domain-containing protein [Pseudoalteromonas shioyasakiensis]MCO6356673.1 hypothetical protein [Pseudoalteromonas shioyasakiensis]